MLSANDSTLNEGSLVVVLSKVNSSSRKDNSNIDQLIVGTFIGYLKDKQVMVLLPDGYVFVGLARDVTLWELQKDV